MSGADVSAEASGTTREFHTPEELLAAVGSELGSSTWITIDQARIDAFADATNDHQWIHTDPQRAAQGPFGATIAHGHLTASLVPYLVGQIYRVPGAKMAINYGSDKVRFVAPVRAGSRIRATSTLAKADAGADYVQVAVNTTIEIEGEAKPALAVTHLGRYYF